MALSNNWNMTDNVYSNSVISNDTSDVVSFSVRIQTPLIDRYFTFDAPRVSSNKELEEYATVQNRDLKAIIYNDPEMYNLSFKVNF